VLRLNEDQGIHTQKDPTIVPGAQDTFKSLIRIVQKRGNPKTVHFNQTGCILMAVFDNRDRLQFIYFELSSFSMKSILILLTRSA
jgi:hypothetical protein